MAKQRRVTLSVSLPVALMDLLEVDAIKKDVSLSQLIASDLCRIRGLDVDSYTSGGRRASKSEYASPKAVVRLQSESKPFPSCMTDVRNFKFYHKSMYDIMLFPNSRWNMSQEECDKENAWLIEAKAKDPAMYANVPLFEPNPLITDAEKEELRVMREEYGI